MPRSMIRFITSLCAVALVASGIGAAAELSTADAEKVRSFQSKLDEAREKVLKDPKFAEFVKRLDVTVERKYLKVETLFDSEAGKAYLKARIAGDSSAVSPTQAQASAELPPARNRSDNPLDAMEELRGDTQEGNPRAASTPAAADESFRESVTRFDDVKAFVVRELYTDAAKLNLTQNGVGFRGLHPFFLYFYVGPKSIRLQDDPVRKLALYFRSPGVKDVFGGFLGAYTLKAEEPKKAQALLDAYIQFRKLTGSNTKRETVDREGNRLTTDLRSTLYIAAVQFSDTMAREIALGKVPVEGGASAVTTSFNIWAHTTETLERASRPEVATVATVYAWMADLILLLDLSKRPANARQQQGEQGQGQVALEEYQSRLGALDSYVRGVRARQAALLELLQKYEQIRTDEERSTLRKQILDLYAGTRTQRPLAMMIADVEEHPNVGALAKGPPKGAPEPTLSRHRALFDPRGGGIARMRNNQENIDAMMAKNGFGNVVDESRARVDRERSRRQKAEGPRSPGDSGGDRGDGTRRSGWETASQGMRGLGDIAVPLTDSLLQANQQSREVELRQRELDAERERRLFERDEARRNKQDAREIAEQRAGNLDAGNNIIENAQQTVTREREEQRLRDEAFARRQQELEAERRKEAEQRAAAQAQLPAVPNTGVSGPTTSGLPQSTNAAGTGPQSTAGVPNAPTNSVGIPAGGTTGQTGTSGGSQAASPSVLSDAQLVEVARSKVPVIPNTYGIDPAVLTPEEIKAALDPLINAKVDQFNEQLKAKGVTVNADLQYSGKGIQSTGLPANHDRYQMWLTRFPELRAGANQAAQAKFQKLLQEQVNALSAGRAEQLRQLAAQRQQQTPSPTAVAQTPAAPVQTPATPTGPAAPVATTIAPVSTPVKAKQEDPKIAQARKVIEDFDKAGKGASGITPQDFLAGIDRYNASQPDVVAVDMKGLVRLVQIGYVKSRIAPPAIAADLGPDGSEAQKVIEEFDKRAGGKSGITPGDFLLARDRHNSSDPYKVELNLPGLIRLVNNGRLRSNVPPPTAKADPAPSPRVDDATDDNRFGTDPTSR
ncbi:MAG: hypothetical protein HY816_04660 [Candidatus Wallbacteria bacterium]|nr:hypothetical protein [Candidatus Wallbacteria bacterium]